MGVTLLIVRQKPQPQKVPSQSGGCDDAGHRCVGDKRCCKTSKMELEINITTSKQKLSCRTSEHHLILYFDSFARKFRGYRALLSSPPSQPSLGTALRHFLPLIF